MGDVRDEPARAGDVPRSRPLGQDLSLDPDREPPDARLHRVCDPDGPPAPLLGRGGERPDAGAPRAADQPKLPASRLGKAHAVLPGHNRARRAPAAPTTSSIRTAGEEVCTSWPHGASWFLASSISCPASAAVTSARTSGRTPGNLRRLAFGATSSITCASGFRRPVAGRAMACSRSARTHLWSLSRRR